jgi:hypothetical protein
MADLHPVPHNALVSDDIGLHTKTWGDWFQKIYSVLGPDGLKKVTDASGYQRLPSGIYIQWGVSSLVNSGTTSSIVFTKVFPNSCLQVLLGITGNVAVATSATGHYGTGNYSTTGFDLYNRTSQNYTFNYMAVGF